MSFARLTFAALVAATLHLTLSPAAFAQTDVSGTISTDSVWTTAGSPYIVVSNVTVAAGATLSVEPGVTVRFDADRYMTVQGTLAADGATFTSNQASPAEGDWRYITTSGDGVLHLTNSTVQYGGGSIYAPIYLFNSSAEIVSTLNNVTISDVRHGVQMVRGTLVADSLFVSNASGVGAHAGTEGHLILTNSDISAVSGVLVSRSADISATTITASGGLSLHQGSRAALTDVRIVAEGWPITYEGVSDLTLSGTIELTSESLNGIQMSFGQTSGSLSLPRAPIPYVFNSFTVLESDTLTVASGNILKFGQGASLEIRGALVADAATAEAIYFTAHADDNLGGDTYGDATQTSPASRYWGGIRFRPTSNDSASVLRRAHVYYAGAGNIGGVSLYDASPTIDSSTFQNNYYGVLMAGTSSPVFTNNTIGTSEVVPIAMSFAANPTFSSNTFSFQDNRYDAIGLLGGTLPASATLPKRDVTNISNVTYYMLESLTIPVGQTLTIEPGVVIKADGSKSIEVQGKLVADGEPIEKIVFTSIHDDNYGNPKDTNKDGNQTVPQVGNWYGIAFAPSSDDTSILDNIVLQFANRWSYYQDAYNQWYTAGAITVVSSSPTISDSDIRNAEIGMVFIGDAKSVVSGNTIGNTNSVPVALSFAANPTFTNTTLTNTGLTALGIISEKLSLSGTLRKRSFAGHDNITYVMLGNVTINTGVNVTVEPGVIVKMNGRHDLIVDGGFKAVGDVISGRIIFTSIHDDNVGDPLDTNGNGNASSPARGNWGAIFYRGSSDDAFNRIENAELRYATIGVATQDAAPTVASTLITDPSYWGISADGISAPVIDAVEIRNTGADPIVMSVRANPQFGDVTFTSTQTQGLALVEGTYTHSWPTNHYFNNSNTIVADATLSPRTVAGIENIAYIISTTMRVGPSAVFTIAPGVVIKGMSGGQIQVAGALIADATANGSLKGSIVFTSLQDDSAGGDTNNDGNNSTPGRSDWHGLEFIESADAAQNLLRGTHIRYGYGPYSNLQGVITVANSYALIENNVIEQSANSGISIFGSANPVVRNNEFLNISSTPVRMSLFANPTFEGNTALNVGSMAIGIVQETYSNSATVPKRDFAGYTNITYEVLNGPLTINTGTTITVPAGVVFKSNSGTPLFRVQGALRVLGTAAEPVIFTDVRDDDYGNPKDTNQNGSTNGPAMWHGARWIEFQGVSDDAQNLVDHTVLRYRDTGVAIASASPTVRNSTFEYLNWGILLEGVSQPVVENNTFHDLEYTPLLLSLVSYPTSTVGNVISGSTFEAIGVLNETLVQDTSLVRRSFGGRENIPYYFQSGYTVGTGATLSIEPGVVLKFEDWAALNVYKGLIAEGLDAPDSMIVFTSIRDDFYGGDTNADSTATNPSASGGWYGIHFDDQALDPLSILDNVVIRYAGISNDRGAVNATNASPSITNSVLAYNRHGVVAKGASNPVIHGTDLHSNTGFGVYNVDQSFVIDATNNWWGNNSGPTHASNASGTGQAVSDGVNFTPWVGSGAENPAVGDVTLNGQVSALDASAVLQHVVGAATLSEKQLSAADVSGSGEVSAMDASYILQYLVGIIDAFPVEVLRKGDSPPSGAEAPALVLEIGSVEAAPGDTITLPINASGIDGLYALEAEVSYDGALLKPVSLEFGPVGSGRTAEWKTTEDGALRFAFAGGEPVSEDGVVARITFAVAGGVDVQDVQLTARRVLANEADVTPLARSGKVTIQVAPVEFALEAAYPNPFRATTTITVAVPEENASVEVVVYNALGQKVRTLASDRMDAGKHRLVWDGRNDAGAEIASGMYLVQMRSGRFVETRKLLLVK